jgi:DNA-binding CsgD family transcriptional regulator
VPADAWLRDLFELSRICVSMYTGELADARGRIMSAFDHQTRTKAPGQSIMATIGLYTHDIALCERAVEEAERAPMIGGLFELAQHLPRMFLALTRGDIARAREIASECVKKDSFDNSRLWMLGESGQMAWSLGDLAAVEAAVQDLMPYLTANRLYFIAGSTQRLRSQLAAARGDAARAEAHAHEALACAAGHELNLIAVDVLETLALLLADSDRAPEAARLLGAVDAFRERTGYRWRYPRQQQEIDAMRLRLEPEPISQGSRLSLAEAVAYAQRGRGERGRPSHGWGSLTPSERRVVALVAEGRPNGEIAAKLFVSLATVKTHLVHIYTKLDLRTRAELAAEATRRALVEPPTTR